MHTNNTAHYNLPQFIGSDIPNPLTDWNDSMQDIDTAMYEIKTQADEIGANVVQDETDISDLQSQANLTDDNITLLNQQTTAARSAATDAQDAANTNASNIATLQQSVANNRTSITQYNNRFNQNVPFAFGIEEVEDPDSPGTMIEKYGYYTNDDPSEFVAFGERPQSIDIDYIEYKSQENAASFTKNDVKIGSLVVISIYSRNASSASITSFSYNATGMDNIINTNGLNQAINAAANQYGAFQTLIFKATSNTITFSASLYGQNMLSVAYAKEV